MATPPTRDGVSPSCVVLPVGHWPTTFDFLVARFPRVGAEAWMARFKAGEVLDESGAPVGLEQPFQAHGRIYYYRAVPEEPRIPFEAEVLYQDNFLVVADKPHFLPVIPSGRYVQETLLVRLKRDLGLENLAPIHRIDRETAGLVIFTTQTSARRVYQDLFLNQSITKSYEAIASWQPMLNFPLTYRSRLEDHGAHFMQVREITGEPNSESRIEVLEVSGTTAKYRLVPVTGRKHQLRAHCAALGIPIRHDRIYPTLLAEGTDDYARPLQLLAKSIAFRDPLTGEDRNFMSRRSLSLTGNLDSSRP